MNNPARTRAQLEELEGERKRGEISAEEEREAQAAILATKIAPKAHQAATGPGWEQSRGTVERWPAPPYPPEIDPKKSGHSAPPTPALALGVEATGPLVWASIKTSSP